VPPDSLLPPAADRPLVIKPFAWDDWPALWAIRFSHLAEHGIQVDPTEIPERPQPGTGDEHEWDFHHFNQVYLCGAGNFWLAWYNSLPIGYVGGQDVGSAIELRRMYVNAAYRRRGVGTALVCVLITHCRLHAIAVVELWTAAGGPGRRLYRSLGFRETEGPGGEFQEIAALTRYTPGTGEIRMRLDVRAR
jgi:GNAT superfamily N-acetyltransferase